MVFLTGSYDHTFCFFQGVNTLGYFYTSQTLREIFSNVTSTSFTVFPLVSRDESSADREFLNFLSCMCSGKSFITVQKSRGPRILPCGIPDCIMPTADSLPFSQTDCDLSDRCGWKKGMTETLFKYTFNVFAAGLRCPLNRRLS